MTQFCILQTLTATQFKLKGILAAECLVWGYCYQYSYQWPAKANEDKKQKGSNRYPNFSALLLFWIKQSFILQQIQIWAWLITHFRTTIQLWLVGIIMLLQLCWISLSAFLFFFCHETAEQILSQNFTVLAGTWPFPGLVYTSLLHAEPVNVQSCTTSIKAEHKGLQE